MLKKQNNKQSEKKIVVFVQCKIQKGIFHKSSWLPEKLAVKGEYVRLSKADSTGNKRWDYGWIVTEIGNKIEKREMYIKSEIKERDGSSQKIQQKTIRTE